MNHKQIADLVNNFENKYPVDTWRVNDLEVWPVLRLLLSYAFVYDEPSLTEVNDNIQPPKSQQPRFSLLNKLYSKVKSKLLNWRINRKTDILILSFPILNTKIQDQWYNKVLDPFISAFLKKKLKVKVIEVKAGKEYKRPRYFDSFYLEAESEFQSYLWSPRNKSLVITSELKNYNDFIDELKRLHPGKDFSKFYPENILGRMKRMLIMVEYFKEILKRAQPRFCVLTCYYDFIAMTFCAACNSLKIPVMDVQHGVQGEYHRAYGQWNKIPEQGFKIIPGYFWCWSESEKKTIVTWKKDKEKVIVGGNPWIQTWFDNSLDFVKYYDKKAREIILKNPVNILFSAQPLSDPIPLSIINAINQSPDWTWWIRLHPSQVEKTGHFREELRTKCLKGNYVLNEATEFPLPPLLKYVDIHITKWSSVVFEAADFKIPSIVIHENGLDLYKDLIAAGIVSVADNNASDILSIARKLIANKKTIRQEKAVPFEENIDRLLKEAKVI